MADLEPTGRRGPVRVLLVEDHQMVLDGMQAAMSVSSLVTVVATALSLEEGRRQMATAGADVVVTDFRLGDGLGTDLVATAAGLDPPPAVLLVTGTDERTGVASALASGCAGFVSKDEGMGRLLEAVVAVADGASVFPPEFLSDRRRSGEVPGASLTDREREVIRLLASAHSAREIADQLYLSQHTVRNHIAQLLRKLDARSQLEAVVIAAEHGIVTLGRRSAG